MQRARLHYLHVTKLTVPPTHATPEPNALAGACRRRAAGAGKGQHWQGFATASVPGVPLADWAGNQLPAPDACRQPHQTRPLPRPGNRTTPLDNYLPRRTSPAVVPALAELSQHSLRRGRMGALSHMNSFQFRLDAPLFPCRQTLPKFLPPHCFRLARQRPLHHLRGAQTRGNGCLKSQQC